CDVLSHLSGADRRHAVHGKEPLEGREPAVRFLQIPATGRLVMRPEILGDLVEQDPVHPRDERLAGCGGSLPRLEEAFRLLLLLRSSALSARATVGVPLGPPDA